jgi:hypothetical protein
MNFVITGGTGFIGTLLVRRLSQESHSIVLLSRSASRSYRLNNADVRIVRWDPYAPGEWMREIDGADTVINLVGKNVFEQRWNDTVKRQILDSRVVPTALLVDAIARAEKKPSLLISASAVGFYGDRNDEEITETSGPGDDILAEVVQRWEGAAYEAERYGVRVATPRIGLVLEKSGGMIGKMLLPFRLCAGGRIGSGRQYLPWVHMDDVVRGMLFPIEKQNFHGVYNLVSPHPVTMNEFVRTFGKVLHRPSWLPVPDFALSVLYGEGAKVILSGQRALPKRLIEAGFLFSFSDAESALRSILR